MNRTRALLRAAVSLAVLGGLAVLLDAPAIVERLGRLRPGWVVLALLLSVAQALVLAWRWRFTAGRVGIELPFPAALAEYYLGNFLNQVLPGGVAGDVSRAWRHARTDAPTGPAVRAVVLERLAGQVVMTSVALLCLALVPALPAAVRVGGVLALLTLALVLGAGPRLGLRAARSDPEPESLLARFRTDAHAALLAGRALPVQAVTAAFTVGTYIAIYLVAARALSVDTPLATLAPLVAPVLMTMLLPVTVAGWGVREAGAAALWAAVGLSPEDGVAISVAYGVLTLVSTLPGALVLSGLVPGGPDRRGRPHPAGSDAPADGARRSGSGSARG